MLISLLLVPIIGSIIAGFIPENSVLNQNRIKQIALYTSVINFIIAILLWSQFNSNLNDYQFLTEFKYLNLYHFNLGVDGISLYFVLLTVFITHIARFSNYKNIHQYFKYFFISYRPFLKLEIFVL